MSQCIFFLVYNYFIKLVEIFLVHITQKIAQPAGSMFAFPLMRFLVGFVRGGTELVVAVSRKIADLSFRSATRFCFYFFVVAA